MNALEITDSDGRTIIEPAGFSPAPRVSLQALHVTGGRILFDVAEPRTGLRLEVADSAAASGWLALVYPAAADPDQTGPAAHPVAADTGPLYGTLIRLMTAVWLRRTWPGAGEGIRPIDRWVLDAEAAELALSTGVLFADAGLAASLIRPHVEQIATALDHAGDDATSLASRVAERLEAAARTAGADILAGGRGLRDDLNEALLDETYPIPDDEYDAFRISHLVEGIVRMRLRAAYATEGVWAPSRDALAPFAAEILAARSSEQASAA